MTDAIDIVIPWVDGADPVHFAKRLKHTVENEGDFEDVGGASRFSSIGEIFSAAAASNFPVKYNFPSVPLQPSVSVLFI